MRLYAVSWLAVASLAIGCGGTSEAQPSGAERTSPSPSELRLRWSFEAGQTWEERVHERMFMLEHPKQPVDPKEPVLVTETIERFEVLEAGAKRARLSKTPISVQVTVREAGQESTFDHQTPPAELRDGLAAQKLAYLEIPLVASVTPRGAVAQVFEAEAHASAVRTRLERLIGTQSKAEQEDARAAVELDLRHLAVRLTEQGLRPPLPADPVVVGTTWTQRLRMPSLFQATVAYEFTYEVSSVNPTMVVVKLQGEGTLEPTPVMKEIFGEADLSVHGHVWIDPSRGVLLEHEEIMEMSVELLPHPELGEGGTMATRLERRRARVDQTLEE